MPQTVEIVRFRVAPEHTAAFLAGREAALAAVRGAYSGMRRACLVQGEGDEWMDIVHWATREEALAAAAGAMALPAFAAWAGLIADVTSMEHATVRASHG